MNDLARRLGERAAPDLWPAIEERLGSQERRSRRGRRPGRIATASLAGVLIVVVFVWAVASLSRGLESSPPAAFPAGTIARYAVPNAQSVAFGGGAAWVSGSAPGGSRLWRVDAATGRSKSLPNTTAGPLELPAFGEGFAWVATNCSELDTICEGPALLKVDPSTGAGLARIEMPGPVHGIAAGLGSVWVTTDAGLVRVDPASGRITATWKLGRTPVHVGVAGGRVWVTSANQDVVGLDPRSGAVLVRVPAPTCLFATSDVGVFAGSCQGRGQAERIRLERIDPASGAITFHASMPEGTSGELTVFDRRLWVGGYDGNEPWILAVDPATGRLASGLIAVDSHGPFGVAGFGAPAIVMSGGAGSLWMTGIDDDAVVRLGVSVPAGPPPTVIQTSPSVAGSDSPLGRMIGDSIQWDDPVIGGVTTTSAKASARLPFTPIAPPRYLGPPFRVQASKSAVGWVFHEGGTTLDVVEQRTSESQAELENSIVCASGDTSCVAAGRGETTLADGSVAVWMHYPYGTSVEWITSDGVDVVVMGPYDTLSLATVLRVADSLAQPS